MRKRSDPSTVRDQPVRGHVEIDITGLTHEGNGVGRRSGKVVFVPGALPGDVVKAHIVEERKSFARAEIDSLITTAPCRVIPRCEVTDLCGGCSLQAMEYSAQLAWKKRTVEDAVGRIGHLPVVAVHDTVPSPSIWNYRNKAMFPVGTQSGRLVAGCYRKGTHEIIPSTSCAIQHPTNNLILAETLRLCEEYGIEPYDERTGRGVLRHVMARVGTGTGESMAVLVTATRKLPYAAPLAAALGRAVPGLVSVVQNVNPEHTNVVLGKDWRVVCGKDHIDDVFGNDRIGSLKFRVSALSFYQINPEQAAQVYAKALECLGVRSAVRVAADPQDSRLPGSVLDLYCGIGTISLFLAGRFASAIGIEETPEAIVDANRNARLNGIENVRFVEGRAERVMPHLASELSQSGSPPEAVVLDPPRSGCEPPVLDAIARVRPGRIVYVSCYPSTLARDLAYLADLGYRAVEIQPFDMFPHTPHVECCCLLERTA